MSLGSFAQASQNLAKQNKAIHSFERTMDAGSHELYCGWNIDVAKRKVGVTVRRDVFSVTLRNDDTEEYHTGYSSIPNALAAGRKRIDLLTRIAHNQLKRRTVAVKQLDETKS